ncbi:hypothetical protein BJ875DRAFT_48322 [Amylocarpus encephaloides]|uniref:Ubiquitin carboxyl-terminal hydrolase n=1 Tax=Amylocarpus encephaloides TaxID=45428 RepID=A0A9P7YRJ5_9HELO|nr:hypothetical protein BJ875DRAFT_48322 [Amylocarpus encephaloides]
MMNGRHLPAGQPPDGRRRTYNQNNNHQQYPPGQQMYNSYMHPYNANYYPQQHLPPPYHNRSIPYQHQFNSHPQPPYVRSPPPSIPHYPHPPIPRPQPHSQPPLRYTPRPQQSPVVVSTSSVYQTPPPPPPPRTPNSSTQSSQLAPGPMTPVTPQTTLSAKPTLLAEPSTPETFRAPLPWLSRPDLPWPARRARRKRKHPKESLPQTIELPKNQQGAVSEIEDQGTVDVTAARPETPSTSQQHSEEANSTNPTTPSSVRQNSLPTIGETTPVAPKSAPKPAAVPVTPALPKAAAKDTTRQLSETPLEDIPPPTSLAVNPDQSKTSDNEHQSAEENSAPTPAPAAWSKPKLWAGLFSPNTLASSAAPSEPGKGASQSFGKANTDSLAEALRCFSAASADSKVSFLKPRGLVNTGNMCYMNSVLQVLVSCTPFFSFLDQVAKRAAHSFKSDTPLIDAMIIFMREYPVIDSAVTVEQLRMRLKESELEEYGEAFTPDFVYNVIKRLPRFSSMRRGHQQDAEEFLGFLLEGLHDECVQVMQASTLASTSAIATPTNGPSSPTSEIASVTESTPAKENGWLEVGPRQKSAVTRSSGAIITGSPITKIFGGNLRSELRVPGLKDSVTLEPYQPLQLDIGAPNVNNIIDALKGLTRSEPLHGDFKSPKGPNVTATKQVFIETVPPVLILHLKRFQYDNAGGTQKIWKKVGYPLELEIPKEVFPRQIRGVFLHGGLPKYRLIAVVYHHGKNASGGHYTVDVRRQDGREWIRLDDTVIRRVRSEDVAEDGSEEDPKVVAAAVEAHKKDKPSANIFSTIDDEEESNGGEGWKQANGPGKKWSSVVNGASTPKTKTDKPSIKDNKVAYLLFYQKI